MNGESQQPVTDQAILLQINERLANIEKMLAAGGLTPSMTVEQEALIAESRGQTFEQYLRAKAKAAPRRKRAKK